jgi:hypothetical protein
MASTDNSVKLDVIINDKNEKLYRLPDNWQFIWDPAEELFVLIEPETGMNTAIPSKIMLHLVIATADAMAHPETIAKRKGMN